MLDLKREFPSLKIVLVGASEGWTVADRIARLGIPVIASAVNDLPASFEQIAATQSNVGRMRAAGVKVSIGMIDDNDTRNLFKERQYAGNLVGAAAHPGRHRGQLGRSAGDDHLAPAEAIGMGGEIGSLAPGRRADVVIWSGDPLEGIERRRGGLYRRRAAAAGDPPDAASATLSLPAAPRLAGGVPALTPQMGLLLSAIAFVGTHFLLSHPLRRPLVRAVGERPFRGIYSLVALITFGAMIYFYRAIGREPPLWVAGDAGCIAGHCLMWLGSILFVGSFIAQSGAARRARPAGRSDGVFAITRHPMMWGFAIWAIVHLIVVGTPKALVFDGAIILLALAGAVGQDRKKARLMGERGTNGLPRPPSSLSRGGSRIRARSRCRRHVVFFLATWLHPDPGGLLALDRLSALKRGR